MLSCKDSSSDVTFWCYFDVMTLLAAGGGAVEAGLSIYLENFATSLGSREQLAIAEFADALLVIPKTLAVNAAKVRKQRHLQILFDVLRSQLSSLKPCLRLAREDACKYHVATAMYSSKV